MKKKSGEWLSWLTESEREELDMCRRTFDAAGDHLRAKKRQLKSRADSRIRRAKEKNDE